MKNIIIFVADRLPDNGTRVECLNEIPPKTLPPPVPCHAEWRGYYPGSVKRFGVLLQTTHPECSAANIKNAGYKYVKSVKTAETGLSHEPSVGPCWRAPDDSTTRDGLEGDTDRAAVHLSVGVDLPLCWWSRPTSTVMIISRFVRTKLTNGECEYSVLDKTRLLFKLKL